jgi:hypothetical protein
MKQPLSRCEKRSDFQGSFFSEDRFTKTSDASSCGGYEVHRWKGNA